jgi:hypothetical protein
MTLTLHLTPATEANLKAESARTGKRPEILALEAVEDKFSPEAAGAALSLDAWQSKFDALLATMPSGNPDADLSRDSIYQGRGQ